MCRLHVCHLECNPLFLGNPPLLRHDVHKALPVLHEGSAHKVNEAWMARKPGNAPEVVAPRKSADVPGANVVQCGAALHACTPRNHASCTIVGLAIATGGDVSWVTVNYNAKQQADMNSVTQETVHEFADARLGLQRFVTGRLCKDCCAGGRGQPGTCVVTKRALPTKSWRTGVTAT